MEWLIVLFVVAVVVALVVLAATQTRSASLKRRFGPEYDRLLDQEGDRRSVEGLLRERTRRRAALEVHDLPNAAAAEYTTRWREAQLHFVDDPGASVAEAEALVATVARERGYPVDQPDKGTEMLSVDYPRLIGPYRVARTVHQRNLQQPVGIDDLRMAFRSYRSLFVELLGDRAPQRRPTSPVPAEGK
ncbi:MAG: hypothetical protein ACRD2C_04325 [Acidimicrobiales bacterium]